jgi:hypothetical protein
VIEGINMNNDVQNFTQYQTHADLIKQIQIIGLRDNDLEKITDTCLIDETSFTPGQFEKKELSVTKDTYKKQVLIVEPNIKLTRSLSWQIHLVYYNKNTEGK